MKTSTRTWIAVALFVPLAAVLLATFACLPAPVGDPETAKLDPTLVGAWQAVPKDAAEKGVELVLVQPWDEHTYLLRYFSSTISDGKEERKLHEYKAWLTTLGNATFLTAQPLDDLKFGPAADPAAKRFWVVFRLDKKAEGTMDVLLVNIDSDLLKGKETREQIEAVLKANAQDKALYGDPAPFRKLNKEEQLKLEETLKKFNVETT